MRVPLRGSPAPPAGWLKQTRAVTDWSDILITFQCENKLQGQRLGTVDTGAYAGFDSLLGYPRDRSRAWMYRVLKEISTSMITTLIVDTINSTVSQIGRCGLSDAAVSAPIVAGELALAGWLLLLATCEQRRHRQRGPASWLHQSRAPAKETIRVC
jgi:hypothetical protein